MKFWYCEDELWPDIEVSTGCPTPDSRYEIWDEADAPPELVARYAELREAFMAARHTLIDHIEGEEGRRTA